MRVSTKKRILVGVLFLILAIGMVRCGDDGGGSDGKSYHPSNLPSKAVVEVDDIDGLSLLNGATDGTYTYSYNDQAPSFQADDILLSGQGKGYLRKVTGVTDDGAGTLTVASVPARLDEAFEFLDVSWSDTLTPAQIQSQQALLKGVKLAPAQAGPLELQSFTIGFVDTVLYDFDQDPNTTDDQVVANGNLNITTDLSFVAKIEYFKLKRMEFSASVDEDSSLSLESNVTFLDESWEKEVARYYLTPITVPAGPVVIILTPVLTVNVGASGQVTASLYTGVTQEAHLRGGVQYSEGQWSPIAEFSNSFDFTPPQLHLGCEAEAFAGAQFNLLVYGVVGPYLEADATLRFSADPIAVPWWTLYGGFSAQAGIRMELLKFLKIDVEKTLVTYEKTLDSAPLDCQDQDQDGYFADLSCNTLLDCNDNCAACYPGAEEICDSLDNNCNNQTDEGCPPICGNNQCETGETISGCCSDCGYCGDGQCCSASGENKSNCNADCPDVCGDGLCGITESSANCCQDCGSCGDNVCCAQSGETNSNCSADCAAICGNGNCEVGENTANCCADCGSCGDNVCCAATGETCSNCSGDCGSCNQEYTLYPDKDAYVSLASSGTNYGSANQYYVGTEAGPTGNQYHALLYFNPTGWGSGSVSSAILHFYVEGANPSYPTLNFYEIISSWSENNVTYDSLPLVTSTGKATKAISGSGWYTVDLTDIINQNVSNSSYGFKISGVYGEGIATITSNEGSNRPYLVVTINP